MGEGKIIITKMEKAKSAKKILFKNSSINLLGYGYLLLLSFFSIPMLLKSLGASNFGVYLIYSSLVPLASTINFGLINALIRYLSLPAISNKEKLGFWQTCFWQFIVISLVVFMVSLAIMLFIINKISLTGGLSLSILVALIIFVNHLTQPLLALPQADQRFGIYNVRNLIVGSGNTILTALLALYYPSLPHIFAFQLVLYIITAVYFFNYANKKFPHGQVWPKHIKSKGKTLFAFGIKNFIGQLASQFQNQVSKFILAGLLDPQAVTVFSIPQNIIIKGAGIISQLTPSFFPLSASLSSKEKIHKLQKLIIAIEAGVLLIGISGIFLINKFGLAFLIFWLKNINLASQAFPVLKILSFFFALTSLTPIPSVVLDGLNKPQIPSAFAVLSAVITTILILTLTPKYGTLGPAYATVIGSLIVAPAFLLTFVIVFRNYRQKLLHG